MITTFGEIACWADKSWKCSCGRRVKRRKKFYQTVNPFNKDADGAIKSRLQVQESVRAKARAWENALP